MPPRHAIKDADWERIKDHLPGQPGQHGMEVSKGAFSRTTDGIVARKCTVTESRERTSR